MANPATLDKKPDDTPKSANEVLARVDENHDYRHEPEDLNTTGGMQRALQRNRDAIQALADYVDGKAGK